jgi:hypothetical protein
MMTLSEEQLRNQYCAHCKKALSVASGVVAWRPPGSLKVYWFCLVHHLILFANHGIDIGGLR